MKAAPQSLPAAGRRNRAAMHIHDRLGDRQPQPQPSKLPRRAAVALLKRIKDPRQHLRRDPHPRVAHLHLDVPRLGRIPRADRDAPPGRRKLDRIAQQVPKHLLQARRIAVRFVTGRLKIRLDLQRVRPTCR